MPRFEVHIPPTIRPIELGETRVSRTLAIQAGAFTPAEPPSNKNPLGNDEDLSNNENDPYIPILLQEPNSAAVRTDFCGCFCWLRPQLPPWMDRPFANQRADGSPAMNRVRSMTYAQLLYLLNLIAFVLHSIGATLVLSFAAGPVNIQLWSPVTDFTRPDVEQVVAGNATLEILWIPRYVLPDHPPSISLRDLTFAFFLLSALAHAFVVFSGCYLSIYYWWIDQCRQPLRWVEYFLSSTTMLVTIAAFCGIRSGPLMLSLATLNALMIVFGWVTEALSRPDETSREPLPDGVLGRCTKWYISGEKFPEGDYPRERLVLGCLPGPLLPVAASLQRLGPFLLGWVPYVICWAILLSAYHDSTSEPRERGVFPAFVDIIVYAQLGLFSIFGLVMFFQQSTHWGCANFYWWEVSYIGLSLLAKVLLGSIVASQVLIFSRFEEIFDLDSLLADYNITNTSGLTWDGIDDLRANNR